MKKIIVFIVLTILFINYPIILSSSYEDVMIDEDISVGACFAQNEESVVYTKKLSECEYALRCVSLK